MKPRSYMRKRREPEEIGPVAYTNVEQLQRYLTDGGRIVPRRVTGHSLKRHREIARAIKRARHIGLLPFGKSLS
jgi:small subunit ribosomal protein S18